MKLGYDRGNGKKWSLVSWRSVEDPSPGGFSMELDPGGTLQIIIMQGSTRYWTSGMWDGEIFAMIPEMNSNRAYKISNFFSEKNESYFNYSVINSSIVSRPVLDVSGQIKLESWQEDSHEWKLIWYQPSTHRKVYAFCGAFGSCNPVSQNNCECLPGFEPRHPESWKLLDRSGGCVRKAELQCGNHSAANGDEDWFLRVSKVKLPIGYMSPEYALEGLFSTKSDVFSFGVLLLEIMSSKKNTGFYQTDSLNLLGCEWDLWRSSRAQDLMDPVLGSVSSTNTLLRYINVGLLCVQESAADRPTMSDVVSMLDNESVVLPSPKQPAFSNLRSGLELHSSGNRPEVCSVNCVTLPIMEARS
uniref:G-type lectin S-receptor-like serine/threonine-protein kinase n=1 Tax=Vitis vinifera TaxID=29760 RepID=F6H288_VITVI